MEVQPGDVLMFKRGGKAGTIPGKIIQLVTGSKYTHCAVVLQGPSGLYVAEQDGRGYLIPLAEYVKHKKGVNPKLIEVWRPAFPLRISAFGYYMAINATQRPYGYACLFDALINHLLGRVRKSYEYKRYLTGGDYRLVHCAGLVGKLYVNSDGEPPKHFNKYTLLEPDDFVTSRFKYVGSGVDLWQQ